MTYQVQIVETLTKTVVVNADNRSEAIKKVKKDYYDEKIVLTENEHTGTEFIVLL